MRVVQIGAGYVGAQKEIMYAIHQRLINEGHKSYILFAVGKSNDKDVIRYENKFEQLLRRGLVKIFGKSHKYAVLGTLRIISKLKRIKPDIVHFHILHHTYVDYPLLYKFIIKKKIPVVFTMHDLWGATGGCYHYFTMHCHKFLNECRECDANPNLLDCPKNKTHSLFLRKQLFYKNFSQISFVAVSDWVKNELEKTYLNEYSIVTIWNSFDPPQVEFPCVVKEEKAKNKIIAVSANWSIQKGSQRIVELAQLLGDEFEITLVGNVPNNDNLKLPDNIVCAGTVEDKCELMRLYYESDLNLSMSVEETFGLTFIEAAMVGTRSMGYNLTAIPQVLRKINGVVVETFSVGSMYTAVKDYFCTYGHEKMSEEEINRIKRIFSVSTMTEKYLSVYSETERKMK